MLLIGGQGALTQHKMGSLQDLPHVDMMTPITKFAATVPRHRARRRHGVHGLPRVLPRRARARPSWRSRATCSTPRCPRRRRGVPEAGRYRASTRAPATPTTIERLADLLVARREARASCWAARCGRARGTDAAIEFVRDAQRPRVHERRRPRHAAARRPAPLPALPPLRLLQRRPDRHRRHAVRLPHGLRQAAVARRDRRADRPRLPHRRQEPRHRPRHRRRRRR